MDLMTIEKNGDDGFKIKLRGHEVPLDMSEKEGGKDFAPNPVEMMVGALGGCIGMMVQRYCDSHGYKDGDVSVSLTFEMADNPKRAGSVVVDLEIPKDVPEKKIAAIRKVVELCPVHATLSNMPKIDVEIV